VVFNELKMMHKELFYYKTTNDLEVDFAIKEKKITKLIQVTASIRQHQTREREVNSLLKAMDETKLHESFILTHDQEEIIKVDKKTIRVIPLWKWILSME
jgi:predicted AAA+ superfamily ATPase